MAAPAPPVSVATTPFGTFRVLANDEYIGRILLGGEHYEADDIAAALEHLPEGGTALDVGAHIGVWSVPLARRVGASGRVIAFEPQAVLHELLTRNLDDNHLPWADARRAAVGHRAVAEVRLQRMIPSGHSQGRMIDYASPEPMNFGAVPLGVGGETVPLVALDDLGLDRVDLLKVDVEGAEGLVAWGARATLARCRPAVVVEHIADEVKVPGRSMRSVVPMSDEQARFDLIAHLTGDLGYRAERLSELNLLLVPR